MLDEYPADLVADITGLDEADLRAVAELICGTKNWVSLWTMGLNQSTHGTWNTNALCNLHLATGAICRPGAGPFSLTGQPNAMGGREMGYMGPGLPGQRSALDPADRAFVEERWGLEPGTIRAEAGTGTIDMYRRMADGEIRAAWIICTNPVASVSNRASVIAGLRARRAGGGPGCVHRRRDRRIRRRGAARRAVGRGRRGDGQQRTHAHPLRGRRWPRPARPCRTGS